MTHTVKRGLRPVAYEQALCCAVRKSQNVGLDNWLEHFHCYLTP